MREEKRTKETYKNFVCLVKKQYFMSPHTSFRVDDHQREKSKKSKKNNHRHEGQDQKQEQKQTIGITNDTLGGAQVRVGTDESQEKERSVGG